MYDILLTQIKGNTAGYSNELNQYDSTLDAYRKEVAGLVKDTTLRHVFSDSLLRTALKPQLDDVRTKCKKI